MAQTILATSGHPGSGTERYLLSAGKGTTSANPVTRVDLAQVLDLEQGRLFPADNLQSLLARGYWDDFTGQQSILPSLLALVAADDGSLS